MIYLDGEEVLRLHKVVIDYAGGNHGVRDAELLLSILESPRQLFSGKTLYPDVWHQAAVYMEKLTKFHVFTDGNKRTALASTARFLGLNGYRLSATNKAAETFIISVIINKLDVPTIAKWLRKHSRAT